jgi:hypothetical protein
MRWRETGEDQGGKEGEVDGSRRGRQREREKRELVESRSHLGKGGWFKLGKSEPAASTLTVLGLVTPTMGLVGPSCALIG